VARQCRRERLVKGKTIKQIARDLGLARNTVRTVLRSRNESWRFKNRAA
jgi:DNA-binding NarL/FixJ family response regulator